MENVEKKHIITIAGDHASGQGTLSNNLQKELGYEIYRNGQYVRKLASEKNMTISEFQVYLDNHPDLDREIERSATLYANNHDNLIIDAKLRMVCRARIF
jgi:cytidylate kinase